MAKAAVATAERAAPVPAVSTNNPKLDAGTAASALESSGAIGGGQIHMVPLDNIKLIKGFNPRFAENPVYEEAIKNLAQSISVNGFYVTKPLACVIAKDGEADVVFVTDGHRRLEATRRANILRASMKPPQGPIQLLPVILKEGEPDVRALNISLVRENEGEKLTGVEQAVVVKRLLRDGMTDKEIAQALNFTVRWVADLNKLIMAPKAIREAAKAGKISATEAIRLLAKHGVKEKDKEGKETGKVDYAPAEKAVVEMLAKAEAKGAAKATRADTAEGTKGGEKVAGVKMATDKVEWSGDAGHKFVLQEVALFLPFVADSDWYTLLDEGAEPAKAVLTENVRFKAMISRPKKEPPAPAAEVASEANPNADKLGDDPAADL